jgi:hypothetical protein
MFILSVQGKTHVSRRQEKARRDKFYLIMHEHLFVFRKPTAGEDLGRIKYSTAAAGTVF